MKHNRWYYRLLVCWLCFLTVIAWLLVVPIRATECRLVNWKEPWEPDPADVAYISRTIWGEARGCPQEEQEAVAWCILRRKDSPDFPDTIAGVVLQPNQWQGYSPSNPEAPFHDMARAILIQHHYGDPSPLPDGFFWCSGDGKHQTFRNSWLRTEETRYYP